MARKIKAKPIMELREQGQSRKSIAKTRHMSMESVCEVLSSQRYVGGCRRHADLVLRQFGNAELLGDPLHLARRRARGVHLGDRRRHCAVDALVALDDVLGEEAAAAQLGYAKRDVADARREVAFAVAVAAVGASCAQLVCLGVHYRVDHVLGERPYQFPQVDQAILEPRHRGLRGHAFC